MGYAIMSFNKFSTSVKSKKQLSLKDAFNHNRRLVVVENADASKTRYNEELIRCDMDKTYEELVDEKLLKAGYTKDKKNPNRLRDNNGYLLRKDAVKAIEFIFTFSPEEIDNINLDKWKNDSLEWLQKRMTANAGLTGNNVISATLHMDEETPHIHAIVVPLDIEGKLNCFHYITYKSCLRDMQSEYAEFLQSKGYSLKRGIEYSTRRNKRLKQIRGYTEKKLNKEPPPINPGETAKEYRERVSEWSNDIVCGAFAYEKKADEKANQIAAKAIKEKAEVYKGFKKRNRLIEDMEREYGPIEEWNKRLETTKCLDEAFKNYPDKEEAERARAIMNNMTAFGYKQRKKHRKKNKLKLNTK